MRLLFLFGSVLCLSFCNVNHTLKEPKKGEDMPSVNMLLLDSTNFLNIRSLPKANNTVVILFDPYCQYCRAETESIIDNIAKFRSTEFCFLSFATITDVKIFCNRFDLERFKNVHVGIDTGLVYIKHFKVKGVPHTSVYSGDHKLKAAFARRITAKELIDVTE